MSDRNESDGNSSRADVERARGELQAFVQAVSHDFGAPIRQTRAFSQLLARRLGETLDGETHELLDYIVKCAAKAENMLHELVRFSRVVSRGKPFAPVDMNALAERVRLAQAPAATHVGATVSIGPLPPVDGDEEQLQTVFQALLANALAFRDPHVPPAIKIYAAPDAERCAGRPLRQFAVRDNGIGIDPKHHERIFEAFARLHAEKDYPGVGMGLTIARRIVERHGGRIWVHSAPGEGTTVCFTLPEAPGEAR